MYQEFSPSSGARGERAVTEVLGAILIFALVLAVLALVQVSAIPAANEQVEFEHSQRVAGDFQALDQNVDAAGTRGSLGSTGVEAGVRYPNRLFFINPGPVGGSLTSETGSVSLTGLSGTTVDEADDYDLTADPFETTGLSYSANYNEYANAPTIYYENGVLFERYENDDGTVTDIVVDRGNLVNGNRISIITTTGDFSTQVPDELSVNIVPVSSGTRAVTVVGQNAEVVLQTQLSEEEWVDILRTQFDSKAISEVPAVCDDVSRPETPNPNDGKRIIDCEYTSPEPGSELGELTLSFEDGSYDLRMARVGLTTNDNNDPTADFSPTGARYLVTVEGDESKITDEQTQRLTVEVRDGFNNPVSGIDVFFSTSDGEFQITNSAGNTEITTNGQDTATSDVNGRATVVLVPGGVDEIDVLADLNTDGPSGNDDPEEVNFDVSVSDADGGGGDGGAADDVNPDESGRVKLVSASAVKQGGDTDVELSFKSNTADPVTIVGGRVNFHSAGGPGGSGSSGPAWVKIDGSDTQLDVGGEFKDFDGETEIGGADTSVSLVWDDGIKPGHFYVLTLEFSNGDTALYFVSHPAKD